MDALMNFLANSYIYFLIAAGVFLLAIIGLVIEGKKSKNNDLETFEAIEPENNEFFETPPVAATPVQNNEGFKAQSSVAPTQVEPAGELIVDSAAEKAEKINFNFEDVTPNNPPEPKVEEVPATPFDSNEPEPFIDLDQK